MRRIVCLGDSLTSGHGIGTAVAFPAILPASLTLLKRHDGRREARKAAAGSLLGAVGLVAFAAAVSRLAQSGALLSLTVGTGVWVATSVTLWRLVYGRYTGRQPRTRPARRSRARPHPAAGRGAPRPV